MGIKKRCSYMVIVVAIGFFALYGCIPSQLIDTQESTPSIMNAVILSTPSPIMSETTLVALAARATEISQQDQTDCDGYPDKFISAIPGYSPNGNWRYTFCLDPNTHYPYTRLIQVHGSKMWDIHFYEIYGSTMKSDTFPNGITEGQMLVVHWSKDEMYVYVRPYWCCVDGPGMLFSDVLALYRLNLETGEVKTELESNSAIGFSSDGKYLAYSTSDGAVHLRNLKSDEDISIRLNSEFVNIGRLSWAPDSKKLVFIGAYANWKENIAGVSAEDKNGFSLLLLNIENLEVTTLIDNDSRLFTPAQENAWLENNEVLLYDVEETHFIYNVNSMQLSEYTTPSPSQTQLP